MKLESQTISSPKKFNPIIINFNLTIETLDELVGLTVDLEDSVAGQNLIEKMEEELRTQL